MINKKLVQKRALGAEEETNNDVDEGALVAGGALTKRNRKWGNAKR